jgi:hypothetical protein
MIIAPHKIYVPSQFDYCTYYDDIEGIFAQSFIRTLYEEYTTFYAPDLQHSAELHADMRSFTTDLISVGAKHTNDDCLELSNVLDVLHVHRLAAFKAFLTDTTNYIRQQVTKILQTSLNCFVHTLPKKDFKDSHNYKLRHKQS